MDEEVFWAEKTTTKNCSNTRWTIGYFLRPKLDRLARFGIVPSPIMIPCVIALSHVSRRSDEFLLTQLFRFSVSSIVKMRTSELVYFVQNTRTTLTLGKRAYGDKDRQIEKKREF